MFSKAKNLVSDLRQRSDLQLFSVITATLEVEMERQWADVGQLD